MLRVSGVWVIFPVLLVTDFDSVEYFPFVPGCAASGRVCSLSSCVISTSSESLVSLWSCLVVSGAPCDVASFLSGSSVPVRGLPSGRVSVLASLCKTCSATVFLLSLVPGVFVWPVMFATGLFALVRPSGIFSAGFAASAGLRDVFPTGFVVPVGSLHAFSVFSFRGFVPTTGCGVTPALALVRAEDDRRSTDVMPLLSGVCRCFVDEATAD